MLVGRGFIGKREFYTFPVFCIQALQKRFFWVPLKIGFIKPRIQFHALVEQNMGLWKSRVLGWYGTDKSAERFWRSQRAKTTP
jgi:hypothetical protein